MMFIFLLSNTLVFVNLIDPSTCFVTFKSNNFGLFKDYSSKSENVQNNHDEKIVKTDYINPNPIQILNTNENKINGKPDIENVGEGRAFLSYLYPIFPQFYDVDHINDIWRFFEDPEVVQTFITIHISNVSTLLGLFKKLEISCLFLG